MMLGGVADEVPVLVGFDFDSFNLVFRSFG